MTTHTPELGRTQKIGLQRSAHREYGSGRGNPAPGEGFAFTIASRECAKLEFENPHDRLDVIAAVGSVAAKRASIVGRGPTLGDVHVAMRVLELEGTRVIPVVLSRKFQGLAHSYSALRELTDAVSPETLISTSSVPSSSHLDRSDDEESR